MRSCCYLVRLRQGLGLSPDGCGVHGLGLGLVGRLGGDDGHHHEEGADEQDLHFLLLVVVVVSWVVLHALSLFFILVVGLRLCFT